MEYGFACSVSKAAFDEDPVAVTRATKRILRYNYEKTKDTLDFDCDYPPRFMRGEEYEDYDDEGNLVPMLSFMWYINTEDPDEVGVALGEEFKAW